MSAREKRPRDGGLQLRAVTQARPETYASGAVVRRLEGALEVPLAQILPDAHQPRQDWAHDDGERRLEELAASIREFGVLQPLVVREEGALPDGRARYVVIAGGRRRAAAERAGLEMVPVVVRGDEGTRVRVLQLLENLQRQSLSPLDEARAYQELLDLEGLTPRQVAARVHVSDQHVRNRLRLLADQVISDAVERRQVTVEAARILQQLPDDEVLGLKERIAAGERLRKADLMTVRERLRANGVLNPRYTGGGRRSAVSSTTLPAGTFPHEGATLEGQSRFDPETAAGGTARDQGTASAAGSVPGGQSGFDPPDVEDAANNHPSLPGDATPVYHPAAVAAWGNSVGMLFLQFLRAHLPQNEAITSELRRWHEGDPVPAWWIEIFHSMHRHVGQEDKH